MFLCRIIKTKIYMMFSGKKTLNFLVLGALVTSILASCGRSEKTAKANSSNKKVGVLLVNHGSRSEAWRNGLLDLEKRVRDSIMSDVSKSLGTCSSQ